VPSAPPPGGQDKLEVETRESPPGGEKSHLSGPVTRLATEPASGHAASRTRRWKPMCCLVFHLKGPPRARRRGPQP
jgi:hypothetical protein